MPARSRYPAGPLAFVAFGLFVLTWSALRLWTSSSDPATAARADLPETDPILTQSPIVESPHVVISVATNINTSVEAAPGITSERPALPKSPAALVLNDFATLPSVAEIAPPVATRIEYDPVVTLEPEISLVMEPALTPSTSGQLPPMLGQRDLLPHAQPAFSRALATRAPALDRPWPYPISLVVALQAMETYPATANWAREVQVGIDLLFAADGLNSPGTLAALERLELLSDDARNVAPTCRLPEEQVLLARTSFGLTRRLIVWRQVQRLTAQAQWVTTHSATSDARMMQAIAEVEQLLATDRSWQDYLLLQRLHGALVVSTSTERGELARRILGRLEAPELTAAQRKLLASPAVLELAKALEPWAAEQVNLPQLVDALEQLEVGQSSQAAHIVAASYQRLRWNEAGTSKELADHLDTFYRNANVRVAISGELLNRLLPEQNAVEEDVNDHVLGARVFGRSQTSSRLRVVLLPDGRRLKLGLEAEGEVDSSTSATKGPATFYSQGNSRFHARKLLSLDRQGLRVWRSQADVETDSELTDLETDFDALPFVGLLARAVAQQQHDENYTAANYEIRGKVAAKAEHRFDSEVHRQIEVAEREFVDKLYSPLARLQLEPTAVDLRTTNDHLIARYRVAAKHQVAAFTPRPQAPAESMLNIQLHQSTINNVLEQLKLDGRRTDLDTLYRDLSRVFGQELTPEMPEDLPEKVTIEFAEQDAVRCYLDAGRVVVVVKLVELSQGRNHKWKNFTVQADYVPDVNSLDAKLVRGGSLELIGERLNFRDQIALRGIFNKVFSKNRDFNLVSEQIAKNPKLQDLKINQFVIQDGWIGLSVAAPPRVDKPKVASENCEPARLK